MLKRFFNWLKGSEDGLTSSRTLEDLRAEFESWVNAPMPKKRPINRRKNRRTKSERAAYMKRCQIKYGRINHA